MTDQQIFQQAKRKEKKDKRTEEKNLRMQLLEETKSEDKHLNLFRQEQINQMQKEKLQISSKNQQYSGTTTTQTEKEEMRLGSLVGGQEIAKPWYTKSKMPQTIKEALLKVSPTSEKQKDDKKSKKKKSKEKSTHKGNKHLNKFQLKMKEEKKLKKKERKRELKQQMKELKKQIKAEKTKQQQSSL